METCLTQLATGDLRGDAKLGADRGEDRSTGDEDRSSDERTLRPRGGEDDRCSRLVSNSVGVELPAQFVGSTCREELLSQLKVDVAVLVAVALGASTIMRSPVLQFRLRRACAYSV